MSDKILKLDQAQTLYQDLRGRIDALPTSGDIPEVPVQDVQVNGTSVLQNGIANMPVATASKLGVVSVNSSLGLFISKDGSLTVNPAGQSFVKNGNNSYYPLVTNTQHIATFYGLAKVAGHDEKNSTEPLGTYTPEAKGAIQKMLGVSDLIAPEENDLIASKPYAIGDIFTANGKLYKATAAIVQDAAIILPDEVGANCEEATIADGFPHDVRVNGTSVVGSDGVANIPVATQSSVGVVKVGEGLTIQGTTNRIFVDYANNAATKAGENIYRAITPGYQDKATFYGLSKVAGVDLANETVTLGIYPETSKTAIKAMLGIQDGLKVVRLI